LASKNNGRLPSITDISFALRETENAVSTLLERLSNGGLIERRNGGASGSHYAPYKWDERQYKSDTSTDRVKRFRQRSKTVTETAPDTETETEKEERKGGDKSPTSYAFFGQTIRLTPQGLQRWQKTYHGINDIDAELNTIDAWWQSQPEEERKNWFHRTAGMLNRKHQETLANRKRDDGYDPNVITV
jgi:hypothetical protein